MQALLSTCRTASDTAKNKKRMEIKTLVKSKIYKKTSAYVTQASPPDLNF